FSRPLTLMIISFDIKNLLFDGGVGGRRVIKIDRARQSPMPSCKSDRQIHHRVGQGSPICDRLPVNCKTDARPATLWRGEPNRRPRTVTPRGAALGLARCGSDKLVVTGNLFRGRRAMFVTPPSGGMNLLIMTSARRRRNKLNSQSAGSAR